MLTYVHQNSSISLAKTAQVNVPDTWNLSAEITHIYLFYYYTDPLHLSSDPFSTASCLTS